MKKICIALFVIVTLLSCKKYPQEGIGPVPNVGSINPTSGSAGDTITITGKRFVVSPVVYFDTVKAEIASQSPIELKVIVPEGYGTVPVTVQVGPNESVSVNFTYKYVTPRIASLSPQSGVTGDTLIIWGNYFDSSSNVYFNSAQATVLSYSQTSITTIVPFETGAVSVQVRNIYDNALKLSNESIFNYAGLIDNNYRVIQLNTSMFGTEMVDYRLDTLSYYKIGPSSYFLALNLLDPTGTKPIKAFITTVDVTNPYLGFKTVIGRDSVSNLETPSSMANRKSASGRRYIAGTNSDFYNTTTTYPRNANMVDGVLGSPSDNIRITGDYYAGNAIFDAQNKMTIDALTYSASATIGTQTMPIDTLNYFRYINTNKLAFFNIYCGKTTGTNSARTEVAITPVNGKINYNGETEVKVVAVYKNKGNNAVSESVSILSGATGAAANFLNQLIVGDVLKVNFGLTSRSGQAVVPHNIAGGRQIIMKSGNILPNIWNGDERHPRTGIGFSDNGTKIYMCVIDGRNPGYAENVYTSEMAQIMRYFGATDALNLDGGGSSTMYLDKIGVVNRPSDGTERRVVAGVFAVSTAPDDPQIAQIAPKQYIVRLQKGQAFTPIFYGLNKYGQVIVVNLSGVTLYGNGLGTISGATFTAGNASGYGYIGAQLNSHSTRIKVIIE